MFELARFRRLLNAHWAEQGRAHAWFLGVGMMLHFVVMILFLYGRPRYTTETQMALFSAGLVLTATVFAGRFFQGLARPESALVFLMRPASGFEKWLLAFLMVLVVYPFAYSIAFQVCHLPAWAFEYSRVGGMVAEMVVNGTEPAPGERLADYALWQPWRFDDWLAPALLMLVLCFCQPFALLGSLWFRRLPVMKTVLAAFLLLLAWMVLDKVFPSGAPWVANPDGTKLAWQRVHAYAIWFGIPVLLWLACYFAVRERELA